MQGSLLITLKARKETERFKYFQQSLLLLLNLFLIKKEIKNNK